MGAVIPKNLRHLPFGGQALSATTHFIGASSSPFLSGGSTDRHVVGMDSNSLVVSWEILNLDSSANLRIRFGPNSGTFDIAAGQNLDNFIELKPGFSYNFPIYQPGQQVNDVKGGVDYSILLVQGSGGDCQYTGMVTVWDPNDE